MQLDYSIILFLSNAYILCSARDLSINTDTHKETAMFKKIIKEFWDILESMGRARAAAILARNGRYKEAQDLYRS